MSILLDASKVVLFFYFFFIFLFFLYLIIYIIVFVMFCNQVSTLYFYVVFRPVEDYNEIASHFIECIYVHSYNKKFRVQYL